MRSNHEIPYYNTRFLVSILHGRRWSLTFQFSDTWTSSRSTASRSTSSRPSCCSSWSPADRWSAFSRRWNPRDFRKIQLSPYLEKKPKKNDTYLEKRLVLEHRLDHRVEDQNVPGRGARYRIYPQDDHNSSVWRQKETLFFWITTNRNFSLSNSHCLLGVS